MHVPQVYDVGDVCWVTVGATTKRIGASSRVPLKKVKLSVIAYDLQVAVTL